MEISTTLSSAPVSDERLAEILANPGFGLHFADHMFTVEWTPDEGWHAARIEPYGPLVLDPATAVLHYAQETFEGMKAYRHADGSIWSFRPEENAARMVRSSHRLAFPVLEVDDFLQAVDALVEVDQRWVPDPEGEKSLYIRPFMIATEKFLGVRPSQHVTFMVITSPAGSYFKGGVKPVFGLLEAVGKHSDPAFEPFRLILGGKPHRAHGHPLRIGCPVPGRNRGRDRLAEGRTADQCLGEVGGDLFAFRLDLVPDSFVAVIFS